MYKYLSLNPLYVGSRLPPQPPPNHGGVFCLNPLYVGSRLPPEKARNLDGQKES